MNGFWPIQRKKGLFLPFYAYGWDGLLKSINIPGIHTIGIKNYREVIK